LAWAQIILIQFAVWAIPAVGRFYKFGIAVFPYEFDGLPVLLVFVSLPAEPVADYVAGLQFRAVRAGFESIISEVAQFDFAFRFVDIPRPGIISQFTAFTKTFDVRLAGLTIRPATADVTF
jgi:hypothetical protein